MCGPKFCSMELTQQVREFAASRQLGDQEAIAAGMEEKAVEFRKKGDLYVGQSS
jgi:phosphomethylpyrimidine synthase